MGHCAESLAFFKKFDLFGIRPSVYFEGKIRSGTTFGFCLTFLLLVFTAICFGYFGQDLYYRQNPTIVNHAEYYPFPEKVTLDPEITPIIIEFNSPLGDVYYTDPSLIRLTIGQLTIARIQNQTNVSFDEYPMEICSNSYFNNVENGNRGYFQQKNLASYFCIPRNLKNLTMQGAFDQDVFQTIKITAYRCNNITSNNTCLSNDEISNKMARGFVGVYFLDYIYDVGNYLHPKKPQPKEIFTNFVLNSQKEVDVFLRNNYLQTEDGIVFPAQNIDRMVNYDSQAEFDFKTENPDFFMIYFRIKQENSYFVRSYRRVQDLLAQIGGFINCFWLFAMILNYFYSNLFVITKTVETIFTIKVPTERSKPEENHDKFSADPTFFTLMSHRMATTEPTQPQRNDVHLNPIIPQIKIDMTRSIFLKPKMEIHEKFDPPSSTIRTGSDQFKSSKQYLPVPKKSIVEDLTLKAFSLSSKKIEELQRLKQMNEDLKNFDIVKNLHLGIFDYIHYYTGCFSNPERERKKMIIMRGSSILRTCLDIKYIIQKFYEIEKLKQILLSEKDMELFKNLPKPELKIEYKNEEEKKENKMIMTINTNVLTKRMSHQDLQKPEIEMKRKYKKNHHSQNIVN